MGLIERRDPYDETQAVVNTEVEASELLTYRLTYDLLITVMFNFELWF